MAGLGTELFQLASGFDPYGAFREGGMARQKYDIEQQKLDVQQQAMKEAQAEIAGDQAKPSPLAGMAKSMLPPNVQLQTSDGIPTASGLLNQQMINSQQDLAASQKLMRDATLAKAQGDTKNYANLVSEARRLQTTATNNMANAKKEYQKSIDDGLESLYNANSQTEYDSRLKDALDRTGIPLPKGIPETWSPEIRDKLLSKMSPEARTKVEKEDRARRDEMRKERSAELRDAKMIAALQNAGTQKFTSEQARSQRAINALGGVASAVETIKEFEIGTNVGMLPSLTTKDGMLNAVRNYAGRKITPSSADQLNTVFSGIGRNLAAIETSGLATGLAELSKSLQSGVYINPGKDDPYSVAMKLADIRRIAVENIKPAIESGAITSDQAKTAQKLVDRIEEMVPYTTTDVAKATRQAKGKGKPTIGEATETVVKPKGPAVGVIQDGYKFKGGDPSKAENWEKVGG